MHGQSTVASALGNTEKCQATVSGEQFFTRSTASCSRPSNTTSQGLSPSPSSMFPPKKTPKKWTAIHEKYKTTAVIGQGTYGIVYKGERREETKNTQVALKRARLDAFTDFGIPETALREITILTDLKHENIMELIELSCSTQRLYMVCEYLEMDLKKFIRAHNRAVPKQIVKQISYEILKGLAFCHGHRVMHRDLKPHNILLDKEGSRVKLADFGLARPKPAFNKTVTHEVVTLWYRAPELLLGHCKYSDAIDIWSVGCIVAEMLSGRALFPGDSEIDTLLKIFRLLGTPTSKEWPSGAMDPLAHFPVFTCKDDFFGEAVPDIEAEATDFLQKLLAYDPEKRLTATEAMKHSWFDDIRPTKNKVETPIPPVLINGVGPQSSENTEKCNTNLLTSVTTTTPRRHAGLPSVNLKTCNTLNEAAHDDENTNTICGKGNLNCAAMCRDGVAKTDFTKLSFDHQELGVSQPLQKEHITFCRTSPPVQKVEEQQLGQQNNNRNSTVPGTMKAEDFTVTGVDNRPVSVGYLQKHEQQNSYAFEGSGVRPVGSSASTVASSSSGVTAPKNRSWWRWNRQGRSKTCASVEGDSSCRIATTHRTNDCYEEIAHGNIGRKGGQGGDGGGDGGVVMNSSMGNTRCICVNNRVTKSTTSSSTSTSFSEPLCAPIDAMTVTASTSSASARKDETEDLNMVDEFDVNPSETFILPHHRQPIQMDKGGITTMGTQRVAFARARSVGACRVGITSFGDENVQSNNFGARGNCRLLANPANVSFVRRSNVEFGGERGRENSAGDKLLINNGRMRPNGREFETRCDDDIERFRQNSSFVVNKNGLQTSSYMGCTSEHLLLRGGDEHVTFAGVSLDGDKSGGSSSNARSKGTCFPAKRRFRRYNPLRCLAGTVLEEGGAQCHTSSAASACTRGYSKEHEGHLGVGNSGNVAGGSCCSSSSGSITCSSSNSSSGNGSSSCDSKGWASGFSLKGSSKGLLLGGVGVDSRGCCRGNNGESGSDQMTEPSLPRAGEMKRRSLPNVALISSAIKNCTSQPFCSTNAGIGVKVELGIPCLTRTACQRLFDMSPATAMYANSSIARL